MARMMVHPFDANASASNDTPDQLMITWGSTPKGSTATIYWPSVASSEVMTLANSLYGAHRLSSVDDHTIQFPSGDVTMVPVPKGQGRLAGLLGVELAGSARAGQTHVLAVRQLTRATAAEGPPPPPPPPQPKVSKSSGARSRKAAARTAEIAEQRTFSWLRVSGAFQYAVTASDDHGVRDSDLRLLAWLKWRVGVTPAGSRWLPVLHRYLHWQEVTVGTFGVDPGTIPPSQTGKIPVRGPIGHRPPGGPPRDHDHDHELVGKVETIEYDRFGDFIGFVLLLDDGHERQIWAREPNVEQLVRVAWIERTLVRVRVDAHEHDRLADISLLRYH
jgi:hypothetical protein